MLHTRSTARRSLVTAALALALSLAVPFQGLAAGPAPSETAEAIRAALVQAQLALLSNPSAAEAALAVARSAYGGEFEAAIARASAAADAQARTGFASMETALAATDAAAFAAARAQTWTAVLAGAYGVVEDAAARGDAATARLWLAVREFRSATRFARPGADATLAIERLSRGAASSAEAVQALRADLLDTYQARLSAALGNVEDAQAQGFLSRLAEHAALAQGYFMILAPAYQEQRGGEALKILEGRLADLRAAALSRGDLMPSLAAIRDGLKGFRAAPLSPTEQARRSAQLLRYLSLIPLEYGRGVRGGTVTQAFEVQEAATFRDGAQAAFEDLRPLLDERDPSRTRQAADLLQSVETQLRQATAQSGPAPEPEAVRAAVEELAGLLRDTLPAEWQAQSAAGDFDVIATLLDQMEAAVRAGQYDQAESARLEAYAVMETGPEARLMVFAPQLKLTLEGLFWNGQEAHQGLAYLLKQRAPPRDVRATRAELDQHLAEAQAMLAQQSAPLAVGANAGLIALREGLEAVVILASLMSSLKGANARLRRPLWLGALGALAATVGTWMLARSVLAALARYGELLEAVVSLLAIGVLLLITNWFFHKVYWTDWIAGFHAQKKRLISGAAGLWLGLATLGFTSVYREGFETVLFLQALVLETGAGVVLAGVASGCVAVLLVGWLVFKMQVTLPHKRLLIVTGVLIGGVLLTMVGHTVHSLQVIGWLPIHAIAALPLPYWTGLWFGLYATWEGLLLQAAAAAFVIGSYYLAEQVRPSLAQAAPRQV